MKFKNRTELAQFFNKMGFKKGAEIGVARGDNAEMMCREIPGLELWCVDPWNRYEGNRRGGSQDKHEANYKQTVERLKPYNVHIVRAYSMDVVAAFPDESLDFVYLDGNHDYSYVLEDITEWSKKVRKGGIVALHDYYQFHNSGIIEAVTEYMTTHPELELQIIPKDKDNPDYDERHPNAWWVK